jgi:hypothetical protein
MLDSLDSRPNSRRSSISQEFLSAIKGRSISFPAARTTPFLFRVIPRARESRDTIGETAATAFTMANSNPMCRFNEVDRRKPGALGTPIRLADGEAWLLARPVFSISAEGTIRPRIDAPLNRMFDQIALGESVSIQDVLQIATRLLRDNYELGAEELTELLTLAPGDESRTFVDAVVRAIFGAADDARTYTDWVRASLLANGLHAVEIPAEDLPNVLAILVATNRTVPVAQFVDSCLSAIELSHWENLV